TRLDKLLDVLVTLRMPCPGGVVVRQTVDKTDLGVTRQDCRDVNHRHPVDLHRRDDLQRSNEVEHRWGRARLTGGDDHVLAPLMAPTALVEQPERLADAGGVAQKYLQLTTSFRSFSGFDLAQQHFRVAGTLNAHAVSHSRPGPYRVAGAGRCSR